MPEVFLTFSSSDHAVAQRLRADLVGAQIVVHDMLPIEERPSSPLASNADAVVAILSRNSLYSTAMTIEWTKALQDDTPVIPALRGGVTREDVPEPLADRHAVDLDMDYD